jgi:hypothetical protein
MTKPLMSAEDMPSLLIILAKFDQRETSVGRCGRRSSQANTSITAEHTFDRKIIPGYRQMY